MSELSIAKLGGNNDMLPYCVVRGIISPYAASGNQPPYIKDSGNITVTRRSTSLLRGSTVFINMGDANISSNITESTVGACAVQLPSREILSGSVILTIPSKQFFLPYIGASINTMMPFVLRENASNGSVITSGEFVLDVCFGNRDAVSAYIKSIDSSFSKPESAKTLAVGATLSFDNSNASKFPSGFSASLKMLVMNVFGTSLGMDNGTLYDSIDKPFSV